jgi:hypothetical protein
MFPFGLVSFVNVLDQSFVTETYIVFYINGFIFMHVPLVCFLLFMFFLMNIDRNIYINGITLQGALCNQMNDLLNGDKFHTKYIKWKNSN